MFVFRLKHFLRRPGVLLIILVLALVLSAILCGLDASSVQERANYEQARKTLPISLKITDLTGVKTQGLDIPNWMAGLFDGSSLFSPLLDDYVKDVDIWNSYPIQSIDGAYATHVLLGTGNVDSILRYDPTIQFKWNPGCDAEKLKNPYEERAKDPNQAQNTGKLNYYYCIIPESLPHIGNQITLEFSYNPDPMGYFVHEKTVVQEFEVIATYTCSSNSPVGDGFIYCPTVALKRVLIGLTAPINVSGLSAILRDNEQLDAFKSAAGEWFAEPNVIGKETPWDFFEYTHFPYALDIDESQVMQASRTMKLSILVNQAAAAMILVLSGGVGFLAGFLTIRSQRRDIMLMRTLGTGNTQIFIGYAVEQMLAVLLGVLLGGAPFRWQPVSQLLLFSGLYLIGLSLSLLIFLSSNLLVGQKEDD